MNIFKENVFIFLDFMKKLFRGRYMLKMMALRELKASYVGSVFGVIWAVLNPLFLLVIYGVVFGIFFGSTPDPGYKTENFFLFLLCGIVPWQFFAQTTVSSSRSVSKNSSLIKKAMGFPSEILPIVTVVSNLVSHIISMILLVLVLVIMAGKVPVFLPLALVYLFFITLFSIGLGWMLSSMNVFLRDIEQVVDIVMMGWFFLTPVIYSPSIVPENILPVMKLNPLYHMVEGYRLALLAGQALPLKETVYLFGVSFVTLAVGGVFFRKLKPWFAEVL